MRTFFLLGRNNKIQADLPLSPYNENQRLDYLKSCELSGTETYIGNLQFDGVDDGYTHWNREEMLQWVEAEFDLIRGKKSINHHPPPRSPGFWSKMKVRILTAKLPPYLPCPIHVVTMIRTTMIQLMVKSTRIHLVMNLVMDHWTLTSLCTPVWTPTRIRLWNTQTSTIT